MDSETIFMELGKIGFLGHFPKPLPYMAILSIEVLSFLKDALPSTSELLLGELDNQGREGIKNVSHLLLPTIQRVQSWN